MGNSENRMACRREKRDQANGKLDRMYAKQMLAAGHITREEYDREIAVADAKATRYNCESSMMSEIVHRGLAKMHGIDREPRPASFFNAVSSEIEQVSVAVMSRMLG